MTGEWEGPPVSDPQTQTAKTNPENILPLRDAVIQALEEFLVREQARLDWMEAAAKPPPAPAKKRWDIFQHRKPAPPVSRAEKHRQDQEELKRRVPNHRQFYCPLPGERHERR